MPRARPARRLHQPGPAPRPPAPADGAPVRIVPSAATPSPGSATALTHGSLRGLNLRSAGARTPLPGHRLHLGTTALAAAADHSDLRASRPALSRTTRHAIRRF